MLRLVIFRHTTLSTGTTTCMLCSLHVRVTVASPTSHPLLYSLQAKKNALTEGHVTHFLYDAADVVAHVHRWGAPTQHGGVLN